jgi:hypothetical protein
MKRGKEILSATCIHLIARSVIDDPKLRNPQLWEALATDYFNNEAFRPENNVNDERVVHLDPSKPPKTPWTGAVLRQTFSTLRSKMTVMPNLQNMTGRWFFEYYLLHNLTYLQQLVSSL